LRSGCSARRGRYCLRQTDLGITIGQYLSYLPVLAVLLIGVPWASRMSLHDLGLRGFDRTTVFAGLIGAVAMYA